jgi:hypothetical protein
MATTNTVGSYAKNDPALTYNLTDFIDMGSQDEQTYENFSILTYMDGVEFSEKCIIDYYIDELKAISLKITTFTEEEINKYRYSPDLLAYDVYGSTQLDFIVMLCNGIIDPKEFDFKRNYLLLPRADVLKAFLSSVYNANGEWHDINRAAIAAEKTS